jgi:hypothetical protein
MADSSLRKTAGIDLIEKADSSPSNMTEVRVYEFKQLEQPMFKVAGSLLTNRYYNTPPSG